MYHKCTSVTSYKCNSVAKYDISVLHTHFSCLAATGGEPRITLLITQCENDWTMVVVSDLKGDAALGLTTASYASVVLLFLRPPKLQWHCRQLITLRRWKPVRNACFCCCWNVKVSHPCYSKGNTICLIRTVSSAGITTLREVHIYMHDELLLICVLLSSLRLHLGCYVHYLCL